MNRVDVLSALERHLKEKHCNPNTAYNISVRRVALLCQFDTNM